MQALDLAAHRPEEYQGKLVVWNEVEYEVGPCAGSGRSRIVHTLINRRSRLCLHVLKIRRLSLQGEAPRKVQPAVIPLSIEVDLPGGKAEVQAHVGPWEGRDDPAVLERLAKADAHLRAQEWTEAFQGYRESIGLLQQAYEIDSHDPLLAMNLAFALARANKHSEARQLLVGVWRIVPMHFSETCLANAAFCAIRAKDLRAGMALLDGLAHTLLKRYDPEKDSLAFILPGVGVWAGENQVQEKTLSSAAEIVTEGVREYAKQASVPETVLALARLYAQGAAETGR